MISKKNQYIRQKFDTKFKKWYNNNRKIDGKEKNKNMNNTWCIYKHTLKITGQVYIGQTNNIKDRWKPSAYKNCIKFYNAIQKYGWDNFEHTILIDNLTIDEANKLEEEYIKQYDSINNGFNLSSGGLNHLASEETKQKMSQVRKGIPHSEEHNQAISKALKQYKRTPEHNRNNQLAQHRKPVQCIETGEKYESLADAERKTGIFGASISKQIRGIQKTTKGYHWRFIDDSELYSR